MLSPIEIAFEPGIVGGGGNILLNVLRYQRIAQIQGAYIERVANHDVAAGIANHAAADIVAAVGDHAAAGIVAAVGDHPAAGIVAAIGNHPAADVVAAIADHAVHAHDFIITGLGGGVANAVGINAGLNAIEDAGAGGPHTIAIAAASGVQDNPAAQVHAAGGAAVAHPAGGAPVAHIAGAALAHVAGAAPVAHGGGAIVTHAATKVVATVLTLVDSLNFTTATACVLGDLLHVFYWPVGQKILAAAT